MHIRFIDSIHQLDAVQWNSLCPTNYPFIRHEFLAALEDSHCTNSTTGWQVQHLVVFDAERLIAAMPGYIKTHSYGEYVFDWSWADAYRRHGLDYYPKWINAIPFTPCTGPRILGAPEQLTGALINAITQALQELCLNHQLSSWHCLFPTQDVSMQLQKAHLAQRLGCQFHWFNHNYQNFDDFLARMNSRKRKNIAKERRQVNEQGFRFRVKTGKELSSQDWEIFYALYRNTYLKRSGHTGYLNAAFFQQLGATMSNHLVMINAVKSLGDNTEEVVAAALFLRDDKSIYGRYWGCFDEYQFLHFETCYYQGIEYAIAHQLQRFDGGAQGEHKIARGFQPIITYSNHWLAAPHFRIAIEQFIAEEQQGIRAYAKAASAQLPFKEQTTTTLSEQ